MERAASPMAKASRATATGRAPAEAGWSTTTSTVPCFAVNLPRTSRSSGSLLGSRLSKAFFPAGVTAKVDVVPVTAGAWDIAPPWIAQLKQGGRLVVPLRMRGLTRSIAFTRVTGEYGPCLESESARICGFVPMQGSTAHREELLLVNGTPEIGLKFDDGLPALPHRLDNAVTLPRHELSVRGFRSRGSSGARRPASRSLTQPWTMARTMLPSPSSIE